MTGEDRKIVQRSGQGDECEEARTGKESKKREEEEEKREKRMTLPGEARLK